MQFIRDYLARQHSRSLAHEKSHVGASEPSHGAASGMVGSVTATGPKEDQCRQ